MSSEEPITIHRSEIESVGEKLHAFRQQLTRSEQIVFDWLIDRAAAAGSGGGDDEMRGHLGGAYAFTPGGWVNGGSLFSALGLSTLGPAVRASLNPQPLPPRALAQRGIIVVGG